jgi:hypothetical protein
VVSHDQRQLRSCCRVQDAAGPFPVEEDASLGKSNLEDELICVGKA